MVGILTFGDAGLCALVKRSTSHNSRFGRHFSSKTKKLTQLYIFTCSPYQRQYISFPHSHKIPLPVFAAILIFSIYRYFLQKPIMFDA